MKDKSRKIRNYLYYGYLPPETSPEWLEECFEAGSDAEHRTPSSAAELIMAILDEEIEKYFHGGCNCVIPISGGWDSRFLLAAAMRRFKKSRIRLLSFGAPGQLDFDIGRKIAESYAINHFAINLEELDFSWDKLLNSVKNNPWTYVPDSYFNKSSISHAIEPGDVILSGFLGEALTGGHYSCFESAHDTKVEFVKRQRRSRFDLTPSDFDPVSSIPPVNTPKNISMSEYWDIAIRQSNCIAPIVTPEKRMNGWGDYRGEIKKGNLMIAPFAHPLWAKFWLRVPKNDKKNQSLYLRALLELSPELAKFPSKYSYGAKPESMHAWFAKKMYIFRKHLSVRLPKICSSPGALLNYVDYERLFRIRQDYQDVLIRAFTYLAANKVVPWIDLDCLLQSHMNGRANRSNEFMLLIGLALNLTAEENEFVEGAS